jgi:hypothetical protein
LPSFPEISKTISVPFHDAVVIVDCCLTIPTGMYVYIAKHAR